MTQLPRRTIERFRDSVPASSERAQHFLISISLMPARAFAAWRFSSTQEGFGCNRIVDVLQFRNWLLLSCLGLSCLGWFSAGLLLAQTSTGGINGTITDQSGANIPGAVVNLTHASTGATRSLTAELYRRLCHHLARARCVRAGRFGRGIPKHRRSASCAGRTNRQRKCPGSGPPGNRG